MKKHVAKVLIAEDSIMQAEALEVMLDGLGIKDVSKAVNGLNAIERFEHALVTGAPFTLVFLDIVMPEMDGQEALRRMRAMEKSKNVTNAQKSVIIMTTALNSPTDMMDALLTGESDDYIVKPVDEEQLQTMLKKYNVL